MISEFQREQILQLGKRRSAKEISLNLGVPEGAIRNVLRKSVIPYTHRKKEKIKIRTIQQSAEFICKVLSELRSGMIDNKSATTQSYILSILIRALSESELEKRIGIIEAKLCQKEKTELRR